MDASPKQWYDDVYIEGYVEWKRDERYHETPEAAFEAMETKKASGVTFEPGKGWTLRCGTRLCVSLSGEKSWLASSPTWQEFSPVISNSYLFGYAEEPIVYHKTFKEAADALKAIGKGGGITCKFNSGFTLRTSKVLRHSLFGDETYL